jgi:uncharacterized protein
VSDLACRPAWPATLGVAGHRTCGYNADMAAIRELDQMLAQLRPQLRPGRYVFTTVPTATPAGIAPVMTFTEDEGLTLILRQADADAAGLPYDLVTAWITLTVHSALDGIGLTAAVSATLAGAGISCNVVAAARHDHLFVPAAAADEAVRLLDDLARHHGREA